MMKKSDGARFLLADICANLLNLGSYFDPSDLSAARDSQRSGLIQVEMVYLI
jgi:hypothetical protein